MNRTYCLVAAGLVCHAGLWAQGQPGVTPFQAAGTLAGGGGGRGIAIQPIPRAETGKPFSATAITQTTQTFFDGTRVNQTSTVVQYRDAEGRVRTETSEPVGSSSEQRKVITIRDSMAGVTYRLDPARKSAVKLMVALPGGGPVGGGARGRSGGGPQATTTTPQGDTVAVEAAGGARGGRGGGAAPPEVLRYQLAVQDLSQALQAVRNNPNETMEDLGTATVNGVPARGTRNTTVVPVGAIGNDREFRSVSERWFSSDLNLLIKSVSTDPRFGTTTYELTNISRQPPDPTLFKVPADYDMVPTGGRGQ